ncbi:MAG: ABC transporter substrate-binding protein [Defluviitaleaceae bacterium]|nr:ABC transporter substrate-binding protein [Defluviitaleaceae bacterium]
MIKKIFYLLIILIFLIGCGGSTYQVEPPINDVGEINIGVLRGPTGLGMLHLMKENEQNNTQNNYHFNILGSPDEIPSLLIQGAIDLAAVPSNLASVLYNVTKGEIQAIAINTLGVLHIMDTTSEINQIEDLRGRTIFLSGLGAVPEFVLNYILNMNGLIPGEDVFLSFRSEHTEIAALLTEGEASIALLPEPFATTVFNNIESVNFALDLTEEWNKIGEDYALVMGVLVGRRDFIEQNKEQIISFLHEYEISINFVNENIEEAAQLAVDFGIIPNANIATMAIPRSNLVFITGNTMKTYLEGFLNVIYNENPMSVGGNMPTNNFFFID